jgi:hypothetical protein
MRHDAGGQWHHRPGRVKVAGPSRRGSSAAR